MTIKEFHAKRLRKINYTHSSSTILTVADFYEEFLKNKRLPDPATIIAWHNLLVRYINDPESKTFMVRKYESNKEKGKWNNRRGAIVQFHDGFEVVYASNFLAHEIFMMAYQGFVPDYDDFKNTIANREMPITSGTKIEKSIRSYFPCSNKTIDCYFAHIMDVNGKYVRNDALKTYSALAYDEIKRLYPLGTPKKWLESSDNICHLDYCLQADEKDLIKAHFLRFLDPMNYFLTPQTKHCKHAVAGLNENIGEYEYLKYHIQVLYKTLFQDAYEEFAEIARFKEEAPADYTGKEVIQLTYSVGFSSATPASKTAPSGTKKEKDSAFAEFIDSMHAEKLSTAKSYCNSIRRVMEELEIKDLKTFQNQMDIAEAHCTDKMDQAKKTGDKKTEKRYRDYRSAIRKYKDFLADTTGVLDKKAAFLAELEKHMQTKGVSKNATKIYLGRMKQLLEGTFSVADLCGSADRLWEAFGPKGQLYDAKDNGYTRAAVKHVADLVREKILAEVGCPYVCYEKGWGSFREKGKHESGYVIDNGVITFSFDVGFDKGKNVERTISATILQELNSLFERAYKNGCMASSDTCLHDVHGNHYKYDYSYKDKTGSNCGCLFEGKSVKVDQFNKDYQALIEKLRAGVTV